MKKYILLIFIANFGFSQSTGYAFYGLGEKFNNADPAAMGIGNSKYFSGNSKKISSSSLSSLWRSVLTRFSVHSGLNYLQTTEFPTEFNHNLTLFSLLFPVSKYKVFGFGIQPAYRINHLEIRDSDYHFLGADLSPSGNPIAYKNRYLVVGGISDFFIKYSQRLTPEFSFGMQYSVLMGSQSRSDKISIYDILISDDLSAGDQVIEEITSTNENTLYFIQGDSTIIPIDYSHQFSGHQLNLEGRHSTSKQEWVLNVGINGTTQVSTRKTVFIDSSNYRIPYSDKFDSQEGLALGSIGLGYQNWFSSNLGIVLEWHKIFSKNIPKVIVLNNLMPPVENSFHMGSFYQVQNPKIGFWNNLTFRYGAYIKQFDFETADYLDYGLTLGLGVEYLANTQSIDVAVIIGEKESVLLSSGKENYISIHIGITNGEKWFLKRRRK